jgi:hypothetical protein
MLNILDTDEIVHQEFIPQKQTMNQHFYTDVQWLLQENAWQKVLQNGALKIGFFTTTMFLLIVLCLCWNFCTETTPYLDLYDFLLFPKL